MRAKSDGIDLLLTKASYGLSICALIGLASVALSALVPDRDGGTLLLWSGFVLLVVGAAALAALRKTGLPGELFSRATRRL